MLFHWWKKRKQKADQLEKLIPKLLDSDEDVRWEAYTALEKLDPNWQKSRVAQKYVPDLISFMEYKKCKDSSVRLAAAYILTKIDKAKAIGSLISALGESRNALVHDKIGDLLGEIGKPAIRPLFAALKGENKRVREFAVYALGKIGNAVAIEPLIATVRNKDEHPWVRGRAINGLADIGGPVVRDFLLDILKRKETGFPEDAAYGLGIIGDRAAVEPLIAALQDDQVLLVRMNAARALGKIKDPRALGPLAAALKDESPLLQEVALEAIKKIRADGN